MPDYSKGKIYCIKSNQTDIVYIGSSIEILDDRFKRHKRTFKKWKNGNNYYCCSFELLDNYEDCYIELIENYPCNSKKELLKREGEIQREYQNKINVYIAGRTDKEYYCENREKILEKKKEYYENNKEEIKEYQRQYREQNKDYKKEYMRQYRLKKKLEKEQSINLEIL